LIWKKIWSRGGKENTVFPLPDPEIYNPMGSSALRRHKLCQGSAHEGKGQEHVKRCLEVAAAGGHNIILL